MFLVFSTTSVHWSGEQNDCYILFKHGYSVSKMLVKLTRFQCFPLQLSRYQDLAPLPFVLRYHLFSTLVGCSSMRARSVENCITVERFNTLNTDLQPNLPNINKFEAGKSRPILTNTKSCCSYDFCHQFCEVF